MMQNIFKTPKVLFGYCWMFIESFCTHFCSVHDSKMTISQNPSNMMETKLFSSKKEEQDKLNCCEECASSYEKEAQLFKPGQKKLLPSWLQSHTTEAHQKVAKF